MRKNRHELPDIALTPVEFEERHGRKMTPEEEGRNVEFIFARNASMRPVLEEMQRRIKWRNLWLAATVAVVLWRLFS